MAKALHLTGRTAHQINALRAFGFELTNAKQTSAWVHGYETWAELHAELTSRRAGFMDALISDQLPTLVIWEGTDIFADTNGPGSVASSRRGLLTASASLVRYTAKRAETESEDQELAAQKAAKVEGERAIAKARRSQEAKQQRRANGNTCECGCGGTTGGGRFLPGHDAKLKSQLIKDALAGSDEAAADLEARGWSKFLDKARERKTRPAAQVRQAKIEDEQERARRKMEQLALLKAASEILKSQGRYHKSSPAYVKITLDNAQSIIDGEV